MWMLAAMGAGSLYAQQTASEAAALKQAYASIKGNVMKAADKMPEDQYGFKASPDIRTFGGLIGHVADVQGRICAAAAGSTPPPSPADKTAKADLVAALDASFKICDGVFDSLTDADATKTMSLGRGGPRNEFATLWTLIIGHSNEEYGYLAVYMRIKGVVPPSSEGRGR
jgi:DinB superfamily